MTILISTDFSQFLRRSTLRPTSDEFVQCKDLWLFYLESNLWPMFRCRRIFGDLFNLFDHCFIVTAKHLLTFLSSHLFFLAIFNISAASTKMKPFVGTEWLTWLTRLDEDSELKTSTEEGRKMNWYRWLNIKTNIA